MSTRLHLIRHGVTESNRQRRYMGRSNEALVPDGRLQARSLAKRLQDEILDGLYSSPLRRAKETAEIVGQPHALRPAAAADFNEFDLSRWQGLTAEQIAERDPAAWQRWCDDPVSLRLDGIETFARLRQRVRRGLEALVRAHAGATAALVTHDGIVRIAVLEGLGLSFDAYRSIPVDNAALTTLDFTPERTYLRRLNDTGHLDASLRRDAPGPADR